MGVSSGIFYNTEGGKKVVSNAECGMQIGERLNSSEKFSSEFGAKRQ
jgi:hypothetical protein